MTYIHIAGVVCVRGPDSRFEMLERPGEWKAGANCLRGFERCKPYPEGPQGTVDTEGLSGACVEQEKHYKTIILSKMLPLCNKLEGQHSTTGIFTNGFYRTPAMTTICPPAMTTIFR